MAHYAAQAFGRPVLPPAAADEVDDAERRESNLKDALRAGRGPVLRVSEPKTKARTNHGIYFVDVEYEFDPLYAWHPEQLVAALRNVLEGAEGARRVRALQPTQVSIEVHLEQTKAEREANDERRRRGEDPVGAWWGTKMVPLAQAPWAAVQDYLELLDKYDAQEDKALKADARLARVYFSILLASIPAGGGRVEEAREALGLDPNSRSLLDLEGAPPALCGQACLAYAVASENDRSNLRSRPALVARKAVEMAIRLGHDAAMSLADFENFVETHPQFRVVVLGPNRSVLYATASLEVVPTSPVYLLLHEAHYFYVANMDTLMAPSPATRGKWCDACLGWYTRARFPRHVCLSVCGCCRARFASPAERAEHMLPAPEGQRCGRCGAPHTYAGCAAHHSCARWQCPKCLCAYPLSRGARGHVCHEVHCQRCKEYVPRTADHRCYIKKKRSRDPKPDDATNYWAYDLECTRDADTGRQRIAVAVFQRLYAGDPPTVCHGEEAVYAFLQAGGGGRRYIAHNGAKYDAFLLFHLIMQRGGGMAPPRVCRVGLAFIQMEWNGSSFIDSQRHIAGSLEAAARDFRVPMRKGFFPYEFYTPENVEYAGPPPHVMAFSEKTRNEPDFAAWYAARLRDYAAGVLYRIKDECAAYCAQDVAILATVLERYRGGAILSSGVDPLASPTIAAHAMAVFRRNHLAEGRVALLRWNEEAFARRGLKGGRVDARQIRRAWGPEEVAAGRFARYADVNSLYPWVLRHCPLPAGAPRWETPADDGEDPAATLARLGAAGRLALVECDVECPADLHHPVLVETGAKDGRLRATLTPKTGGVYPCVELRAAAARGYTITRITRMLVFEADGGLFAEYVDEWYERKRAAKAAGDATGLAVSKLMLNSLWGKFAQRDSEGDTVVYRGDPSPWYADLMKLSAVPPRLKVKPVYFDEDYFVVQRLALDRWGYPARPLPAVNVALAAFVTAHARLKLYSALEALGERVIYHDTDSVIYEVGPLGDGRPYDPLAGAYGDALGEWKDETDGDPIVDGCWLGPKTYSFRTLAGKETVKCKGFAAGFTHADYAAWAAAYFAGAAPAPLSQAELRFTRTLGGGIHVHSATKATVPALDKVHVVGPALTLPFGHRDAPACPPGAADTDDSAC